MTPETTELEKRAPLRVLSPAFSSLAMRAAASRHSYAVVPVLIAGVLFIMNVIEEPGFVDRANWAPTLAVMCPYVFTSLAMALPVLSGNAGLDLSVGPFTGFVTVIVAAVLVPAGIRSPELLVPVTLAFGFAAGSVNGALVSYVRLPAIIATLGTYLFYTGMATQVLPLPGGTVPAWLAHLDGSYGPVPGVLIVFAAVALAWTLFSRTAYLTNLLAVGGNDRTAYTSGINVAMVRLWSFALGGTFAAIAGLMLTGLLQSGDGTVGSSYTISAITAVALGGIGLTGGRGGLFGAATGGVVLFLLENLLTVSHVNVWELNIFNGAILILALTLNGAFLLLRNRSVSMGDFARAH